MTCPAPVKTAYRNMRFLITHSPTNASLQELKKNRVTTIVRICEAIYNIAIFEKESIQVLDSAGCPDITARNFYIWVCFTL
uniref:Uncharacterized protein n=1 Tax=Sus scrofa TaxID=9823 RepID=A0A8D0PF61_PIG